MATRRYGRRLRRGAAGTAVAAAAMAALGASQAPGLIGVASGAPQDGRTPAATATSAQQDDGTPIDGGSPYVTQLPPLNTPTGPVAASSGGQDTTVTVPAGGATLPTTVLAAYERAQELIAKSDPGCELPWQLLAAIGQVESGQARGGAVDANGTTYQPILGPVLNGDGFADITDTDGGQYDGDAVHDRAVGPMQFIPSTWRTWGADGNNDGVANPNNIYDAALAAGHYLCADGRDLAVPADMDQAILGYNHSDAYLDLVRSWYEHFVNGGVVQGPDKSGSAGPTIPAPAPVPSTPATTSPSASPSPSSSPSASPKPSPTKTAGGSASPSPSASSSPTGTPTGSPSDSPTGGQPSSSPTTGEPSSDPTTPTDPPTTPGCPTDPATPTPTDSGQASPSPSPTDSGSASPTPDPCATDTTSPTPSDSPSASEAATADAGAAG
ncbi:lytic transglycosylase domain-containing protein [Actinacidiphila yeochonensis]|uniref:lytic transglycosylase domain-containing protein n=1 Tax=Actinacidiphila yeochonensis TaxID=89050 RepID=UPI0005626321|nr:lytic transglycosylase domain-containing protein [Actinacidiphila yeochonensis]